MQRKISSAGRETRTGGVTGPTAADKGNRSADGPWRESEGFIAWLSLLRFV